VNFIDILVFGLIAIFVIIDGIRGFIKSIYFFLFLIIGFWLAGHYTLQGASYLKHWLPPLVAYIGSVVIILLIAVILSYLLGFLLGFIFQTRVFKPLDHLLGVLIGIIKGFVMATIILMIVNIFYPLPSKWKHKSYTYPYITKLNQWMVAKVSKRLHLSLEKIGGRNI